MTQSWDDVKRGDTLYFIHTRYADHAIMDEPLLGTATVVAVGPARFGIEWENGSRYRPRRREAMEQFSLTPEQAWDRTYAQLTHERETAMRTYMATGRALSSIDRLRIHSAQRAAERNVGGGDQ